MDKVGGSVDRIDDPSGIVRENTLLSRHYRLLSYEAAHQTRFANLKQLPKNKITMVGGSRFHLEKNWKIVIK